MEAKRLQLLAVAKEAAEGVGKQLPHFAVSDHHSSTPIGHRSGVLRLMIFRHVRRRHKDGRLTQQTQLGDRAGSGTRHDEVGRGIGVIHPRDERPNPAFGLRLEVGDTAADGIVIAAARLPDQLNAEVGQRGEGDLYGLVDGACAEATAEYEQRLAHRVEAEVFQCLVVTMDGFLQVFPHRVARQDDLLCGKETLHARVGHTDTRGTFG